MSTVLCAQNSETAEFDLLTKAVLKRGFGHAALLLVMALWGLHLGYPMTRLQYARWTFLGFSVPSYYFFTVVLMTAGAVLALASKSRWTIWERLWWALPLLCLPGILASDDRLWSLRQCLSWMIRGLIPGGVLLLTAARRRREPMLVYWMGPIVLAAALVGLSEIFFGYNPLWKNFNNVIPDTAQPANPFYRPTYQMAPEDAPRGTQGNRIPYASTLVGFFPLGLWLLKYKKKYLPLHVVSVSLLLAVLLLARSRAAWMGLLASLLLMPALGFYRRRREAARAVAIVLIGMTACLALPTTRRLVLPKLMSFHLDETNIKGRLDLLKTGAILKDRGILGVGFGQYASATDRYYHGYRWLPYYRGQSWIGTPDDQYLRWAIENGLPSLALLLAFFAGLARAGWREIQSMEDVELADYYRSILVGWLSVAATFFFFDGFYWGACNMTFWCFLGLFGSCLAPEVDELHARL